MASTSEPFTREEWNDLVRRVNDKIAEDHEGEKHKDDGDRPCDPPDELEEAEEDHIWTREDVEKMRDALEDMCPNWELDELDEPDQLWKKWIIDQMEEGIEQAWCDCEEEECPCEERDILIHTVNYSCSPQGCDVVWCPSQGADGCQSTECPTGDWAALGYAGMCIVEPKVQASFALWWIRPRCTNNSYTGDCGAEDGANGYWRDGGTTNCQDGCVSHRDARLAQWGIQDECTVGYPPQPAYGGACRQTCLSVDSQPCKPCTTKITNCFLWWCISGPCVLGVPICGEEPAGYCDSYDCAVAYCNCKSSRPDYWELRVTCSDDYDGDGMVYCGYHCCPGKISSSSYSDPCGICEDECGYYLGADTGHGCCWVACECDEDNESCELPEDDPETCWNEKNCFCKDQGHEDYADEEPCDCADCPCGECGPCEEGEEP